MTIHPLFAEMGTTHPRFRGSRYYDVLRDLRANKAKVELERANTKFVRHLEASNKFHQQGELSS